MAKKRKLKDPTTVNINFRLHKSKKALLLEELAQYPEEDNRGMSWLMNKLVNKHLKEQGKL